MSTLEKQIKSFLGIENLPISEATNYQILQELLDSGLPGRPDFAKQIEIRMIELNKTETDYQILHERLCDAPSGSDLEKQIEIRMIELNKEQLPKIVDYQILQERLDKTPSDSDISKQIEIRMMKLNEDETNYQILQKRFEDSTGESYLEKQIEIRMMELISLISKEHIPDWFSVLVKTQTLKSQPSSIQSVLNEKCQEILAA